MLLLSEIQFCFCFCFFFRFCILGSVSFARGQTQILAADLCADEDL